MKYNSKELTNKLFKLFSAFWGAKWSNQLLDPQVMTIAISEWEKILFGLDIDQISFAIDYCKNSYDFPPSLAQFKKAALGIIGKDEAWAYAKNHGESPYSHGKDAVYIAWHRISALDKQAMTVDELKKEFFAQYSITCNEILGVYNVPE